MRDECVLMRVLERTFLAWLRTSLAFASIGIAITQLCVPPWLRAASC
jgi:uncharacterized membrane protein YidH (DUF202 family)